MIKEEPKDETKVFLADVISRLTGARVAVLNGDKVLASVVRDGEVRLETKKVTLPRKLLKVVNYIQGHITSYQEPGDSRLTVIVGIDKFELHDDTVSFDIGFARDVAEGKSDPKQDAKDTKLAAKAPPAEAFKVAEVVEADQPKIVIKADKK